MAAEFDHPCWRWEPYQYVSINKGGGPERVVTDDPDPDFVRRPVGFVQPPAPEREPLLWEGDDS